MRKKKKPELLLVTPIMRLVRCEDLSYPYVFSSPSVRICSKWVYDYFEIDMTLTTRIRLYIYDRRTPISIPVDIYWSYEDPRDPCVCGVTKDGQIHELFEDTVESLLNTGLIPTAGGHGVRFGSKKLHIECEYWEANNGNT